MYLFVYKTTHKNGKYYIGRHQTENLNDNYFGSGRWVSSIKKKSDLSREIIKEAKTFDQLCELEEYYINLHWEDPLCMNYKKSSTGFDRGETNPMYGKYGELNPMFHKRGKDHPSYGKKHSEETNQKKRKALINKSYEQLHGKLKAEEIKDKLRKPKSEEHKQKLKTPKHKLICRIYDKKEMSISNFINWCNQKPREGKRFYFKSEDGEIIKIKNLNQYCKSNNLNYVCMKDVNKGKQKSHKGYYRYGD